MVDKQISTTLVTFNGSTPSNSNNNNNTNVLVYLSTARGGEGRVFIHYLHNRRHYVSSEEDYLGYNKYEQSTPEQLNDFRE